MQANSHSIPLPLWDALDSVFQKKVKELIKDIATACRQPEKPLWDAYRSNKHTLHILDATDPTNGNFECEAFLTTSHIHTRCRKPVLFGKKFCGDHEYNHNPSVSEQPFLRRIISEENEIYFVNKETNEVFNHEYKKIGLFQQNRILLYEIMNETEYE